MGTPLITSLSIIIEMLSQVINVKYVRFTFLPCLSFVTVHRAICTEMSVFQIICPWVMFIMKSLKYKKWKPKPHEQTRRQVQTMMFCPFRANHHDIITNIMRVIEKPSIS